MNRRTFMRLGAGVSGLACGVVGAAGGAPLLPERGKPQAPRVSYPWLDGGQLQLPVAGLSVVNFWASWCRPCVAELPSLNRLYDGGAGPQVISINVDESADRIREFLQQVPIDYPVAMASAADVQPWRVLKMPTTLIVDARGRIRFRATGERDWNDEWVAQALASVAS